MRNRENIIASRNKALARFKQWLGRNDLVGPEEIKDIRPKNEDSAKKNFLALSRKPDALKKQSLRQIVSGFIFCC